MCCGAEKDELASRTMSVKLNKNLLVDLGGWSVLKTAKGLHQGKCVREWNWENKTLMGIVEVGEKAYYPRLCLRSTIFAKNQCNCFEGQRGEICPHAIALCLEAMAQKKETPPKGEGDEVLQPLLKSLVLSGERGIPLQFRILLPPNLERTAQNDRIMVKIEAEEATGDRLSPENIDREKAYRITLPHITAAAHIERWCEGKLFGLLQLSRKQLAQLVKPLKGQAVVSWVNNPDRPIQWEGEILPGVHCYLEIQDEPNPEPVEQPRAVIQRTEAKHKLEFKPQSASSVKIDGSPNFLAVELPSREAIDYKHLLDLVKQYGFKLEPSNRRWWLRGRHKTLNFLAEHYHSLAKDHRARFTENFQNQFKSLEFAEIQASIDAVDTKYALSLRLGKNAEETDIQSALTRGEMYWESGNKIVLAPSTKIRAIEDLQQKLGNDPSRPLSANSKFQLNPWQLADAEALLDEVVHLETPETWQEHSKAIKNLSALEEAPVGDVLSKTLRLYQKIGTAWMYYLFKHKLAGILADEMGLGKTLQALSLMVALSENYQGQILVVAPAGLLTNWQREAMRFTPELKVCIHHGPNRASNIDGWGPKDLVITSYTTLTQDIDWISKQSFLAIFGDEAQHIKNRKTQNAGSLMALKSEGRFLLTGTPIENSIADLQSLYEFLLPGYLVKIPKGANKDERAWYHQRIRQQAAPYILRRTKAQVAPELPEKIEQVIYCSPTIKQSELYESVRKNSEEEIFKLEQSTANVGRLKLAAFTQLLRLRQVCADPRILRENLEAEHSAKWLVLRELLYEAMGGEHRILVFSQFVSVLSLLKAELETQKIPYCYIDGATKDRLAEADRFNQNEEITVFLISLKAGGTGLNLTGADTVVHYDPWWNPAIESQATDRAHRIGQKKVVTSIKLIMQNSAEEKVLELQRRKADLLEGLFEESEARELKLTMDEIKSLMTGSITDS